MIELRLEVDPTAGSDVTRLLGSPPHRGFTPHLLKDPESWVHLFEEMGKIKIKRRINTSEVNLQMMRVDSTRVRQNEVPNFTRRVELEDSNLQLPSPSSPQRCRAYTSVHLERWIMGMVCRQRPSFLWDRSRPYYLLWPRGIARPLT